MLIEQIIEVKLRKLGFLNRTCSPKAGHFRDKTKFPKANLRVNYIYCQKYRSRQQCTLIASPNRGKITYKF